LYTVPASRINVQIERSMENHEEIIGASAWSPLELGTWIGKSQAFGAIAKSCTGAEAACLKQIRDQRSYESLGLTWEQFCPQHIGISRLSADRLIGRLEEFGEPYFQLAGITRISAESFRLLAPAVTEEGIEVDGAVIPITAENANRIRAAVQTLRERLLKAEEATPAPAISMLVARMDAWYEEVSRMAGRPLLDAGDKTALQGLVQYSLDKLRRLAASPGLAR
jgi:hypothetical protein